MGGGGVDGCTAKGWAFFVESRSAFRSVQLLHSDNKCTASSRKTGQRWVEFSNVCILLEVLK